jgi:HMG (high mobility group) box
LDGKGALEKVMSLAFFNGTQTTCLSFLVLDGKGALEKVMSLAFFNGTKHRFSFSVVLKNCAQKLIPAFFPQIPPTTTDSKTNNNKMSLYNKMQKMVDNTVEEFCRRLAEKHSDLVVEELMALWKETAKSPKKSNGKPKKKTAYMNFSQMMRAAIKKENPDIKFGELSGELAKRWNALTPDEKATYAVVVDSSSPLSSPAAVAEALFSPVKKPTTPIVKKKGKGKKTLAVEEEASSPKGSPMTTKTKSSPKKKTSLADLKKLCKEKGLSIKGLKKREEFEELLESIDGDAADSEEEGEDSDMDFGHTLVEESDDDGVLA